MLHALPPELTCKPCTNTQLNIRTMPPTGLLSRVVPLRRRLHQQWVAGGCCGEATYPLKLVIMSATLRTSDFTENKQ
jgi:hypothetical protein